MNNWKAKVSVVRCLLCEVNGLEPEGKYLLVRLLLSYQADGGFVSTAKELSEGFGVSLPGVGKALKTFEGLGLFSVVSAPDGRGRPKRRFTFTKRLAALFAKVKLPESYKPAFSVESFLTLDGKDSPESPIWRPDWNDGVVVDKGKSGGFSIANRLLIAVMLTQADRFGVVSSLGLAELRKATGLSKERLIYRLARLVATGVIRSCAPGATGRYLLGPAKSIYILNLADPELSVLGHQPVVFVRRFESESDAFTGWSSLLGQIYNSAIQPPPKEGVGDSEVESLGRLTRAQAFFRAEERRYLSPALEFRLLSYASALLSNHWELIPASPTQIPICVPELQKAMSEDFSPPGKTAEDVNAFPAEKDLVGLHDCLWDAVSRKASEVKCLLLSLKYSQVDQMEYLVLPDALKSACLTLLALPKNEAVARGCYVWRLEIGGYKRYSSESEISVSDRLDYGLMSQPKRRVGGGHQN